MSKIQSVVNYQNNLNLGKNQSNLAQRQEYKIAFGQEQATTQKNEQEEPKKSFSVKKLTNYIGVAAWFGVVGYSLFSLKLLNRKSPEMIAESAKSMKKKAQVYMEKLANPEANDIDKMLEGNGKKGIIKFFYKLGEGFQTAKMKLGGELFNNLLYAFGTLVVMPLVVLFSPFGKKDSSKEDKMFAVLRQPLSVAATLGMQFTFDKLIDKNVPGALKNNYLEDRSILDANKKIILTEENFEKIKYNADSAKEGFKKFIKGMLTDEEIKTLFALKTFEDDAAGTYEGKLKDILNNKYKELKINKIKDITEQAESFVNFKKVNGSAAENIEKLIAKFNKFTTVLTNNKGATQKAKTWVNVLAASAIGCTFLNVIYGKTMKALKSNKDNKLVEHNEQQNVQNKEKEAA